MANVRLSILYLEKMQNARQYYRENEDCIPLNVAFL